MGMERTGSGPPVRGRGRTTIETMDLTPQQLREVEFRERWRGYDPDQVDDLLERLAVGVETLQRQLDEARREAQERAEADTAVRRTLVLAQRTADEAVTEAQANAERLVAEAEERGHTIEAEAREYARQT